MTSDIAPAASDGTVKAFLISLDPAGSERNRRTIDTVRGWGLDCELVPAVDGRKLDSLDYYRHILDYAHVALHVMSPSEVGCALSHRLVFETVVREGLRAAVVFEDDVILHPSSGESIRALLDRSDLQNSYVHLGGMEGMPGARNVLGRRINATPDLWEVRPEDYQYLFRTVGYIASASVARGLLRAYEQGLQVADHFRMSHARGAFERIVVCDCVSHPMLAQADPAQPVSRIQAERSLQRSYFRPEVGTPLLKRLRAEFVTTLQDRARRKRGTTPPKGYHRVFSEPG